MEPILPQRLSIATSVWGQAWCRHLQQYAHYQSRLPQGRTCLRRGHVADLRIATGRIEALVESYEVSGRIMPLDPDVWAALREHSRGQVASWLDLLQGKLSAPVMTLMCDPETGLFPTPSEIHCVCTCVDDSDFCKHAAAALYAFGLRLDDRPEDLFLLRGVNYRELVADAADALATPPGEALDGADLEAMFGLTLDD